jgi:hypothetical protein
MEVWQACFDHYVKSFLSKIAIMASAFSAVVGSPGLVQAFPKGREEKARPDAVIVRKKSLGSLLSVECM